MAEVVNKNQQVYTAGLAPKASYSRVLAVQAHAAAGAGNMSYSYTHEIGQNFWLLDVKIWLMNRTAGGIIDGDFWLMVGNGIPPTPASMRDQWANIIQMCNHDILGFSYMGGEQQFSWEMGQRHVTKERRLGLVLQNGSATLPFEGIASFQISEG